MQTKAYEKCVELLRGIKVKRTHTMTDSRVSTCYAEKNIYNEMNMKKVYYVTMH